MPTAVKVPSMGESISSGILASWHVAEGDYVEKDQVLYELETDKVTSEATAEAAGVIALKAEEGDEVEIGQVVAEIDESAEKPAGSDSDGKEGSKSEEESQSEPEEESEAPKEDARPEASDSVPKDDSGKSVEKSSSSQEKSKVSVSPAVRRIAAESGVDPDSVAPGSGKDGRVTKGDMLEAIEASKSKSDKAETKVAASISSQSDESRTTRKKMTPLRRKIAERLVAATNEAALLTTFNEVDMSSVMATRKKYQEDFVATHGVKLGFMSFFVKAVVDALKAVPGINAQIDGDSIIENHYYDVGVAVGTDKGLMVPVLRECDSKSFAQIEKDILDFAKRARDGKIGLDELSGGVFTITNGGIYGSMLSTPLLNMPQSGILGMHNITQRAVVIDGEIVARPMMYLALSYDHRVVDGKEAVTFLVKVKQAIENPERMLFGV